MSNYSRALEFCIENGIPLNEYESLDLYVTMEGANIEYTKKYKEISKYFRGFKKNIKQYIKSGDKKKAKQECENCKKKLIELQKDVNNIKSNTPSNIISVLIPTLIIIGTIFVFNKTKKAINNKIDLDKNKFDNNYEKEIKNGKKYLFDDKYNGKIININLDKNDKNYIYNRQSSEEKNFLNDIEDLLVDVTIDSCVDASIYVDSVKNKKFISAISTLSISIATLIKTLKDLYSSYKSTKSLNVNAFKGAANNLIKNCYKSVAAIEYQLQ